MLKYRNAVQERARNNLPMLTIQYLLESAFCLSCLYLLYRLLLHRETFFQWNRAYLLLAPVIACLIPALHFQIEPVKAPAVVPLPALDLPVLVRQAQAAPQAVGQALEQPLWSLPLGEVLRWFYLLGAGILLVRLVWQVSRLLRYIRTCRGRAQDGVLLSAGPANAPLASFFGFVFWRPGDANDTEQRLLFEHEMVHVQQRHSLDLILMEILIALQWFNPLLYMYRRSLRAVHEYIADDYVVRRTRQRYAYAQLLVRRQHTGNGAQPGLVNTFHSQIKNRLIMLAKHPSCPSRRAKYLFALPLFAALLLLFSFRLVERLPEAKNTAALVQNYAIRLAEITVTAPKTDAPYIFYWGQFQCRLARDAANDRYAGSVRLTLEDFRASVTAAPYLWDGKAVCRLLAFDLADQHIESNPLIENYITQWQKISAWALLAKSGDHFQIRNLALPNGKSALIDLFVDDNPAPADAGYSMDDFVWGNAIWSAAAQFDHISMQECLQMLHRLPVADKLADPERHGRLTVYSGDTDKSTLDLYFYPAEVESASLFFRNLEESIAWIKPGSRLVFEDIAESGPAKIATLEIVDDEDPRLHSDGPACVLIWGGLVQPLGVVPNTSWIQRQDRTPYPHAALPLLNTDFSAGAILALLDQKPRLRWGNRDVPVRSMRIRYEDMVMGFYYTESAGFPERLKTLLQKHFKAGERITISFLEAPDANFSHLDLSLVAKNETTPAGRKPAEQPQISLRAAPNPAHDEVAIEIELPKAGPGELTFTDAGGAVRFSLKTDFQAGSTPLNVPLRRIGIKGILFVQLKMPYGIGQTRLIVE